MSKKTHNAVSKSERKGPISGVVNSGSQNERKQDVWGVDLHVHSTFSPDSQVDPERACVAAVARGIKIMGFTDHAEFMKDDEAYIGVIDQMKIQAEIERLRKLFLGKLEILYGVEVGYIPGMQAQIRKFLDSHPFDYAIGSVHYVDGVLVSRWVRERETAAESFMPYYESLLDAARAGLFQILGHLDYVRKYMFAPQCHDKVKYETTVNKILETAAQSGLVLELNTSGWRHMTEEPYPASHILERFALMEGRVTIGSDAHKYYEVGYSNHKARRLLCGAGFDSFVAFRKREPFSIPL